MAATFRPSIGTLSLKATRFPASLSAHIRNLMIDVAGTRDLYPIHHDRSSQTHGAETSREHHVLRSALWPLVTAGLGRKASFESSASPCGCQLPRRTMTSRGWVAKSTRRTTEPARLEIHLDTSSVPDTTIPTSPSSFPEPPLTPCPPVSTLPPFPGGGSMSAARPLLRPRGRSRPRRRLILRRILADLGADSSKSSPRRETHTLASAAHRGDGVSFTWYRTQTHRHFGFEQLIWPPRVARRVRTAMCSSTVTRREGSLNTASRSRSCGNFFRVSSSRPSRTSANQARTATGKGLRWSTSP